MRSGWIFLGALAAASLGCAQTSFPGGCDLDEALCADAADASSADTSSADTDDSDSTAPMDSVPVDEGTDAQPDTSLDTFAPVDSGTFDVGSEATDTPGDAPTCGADPCTVSDATGVFVSSSLGSDSAAGTMAAPVKTLQHALALAASTKHRVFACAESFTESLNLVDGVDLVGGVPCAAGGVWGTPSGVTEVLAPTSPAIKGNGLTSGAMLANLRVVAPDAAAPSDSSIAIQLTNAKKVRIYGSSFEAGQGANGGSGPAGVDATSTPQDGNEGTKGDTCSNFIPFTGAPYLLGGAPGMVASKGGAGASSYCYMFSDNAQDGDFADAVSGCGKAGKRGGDLAPCVKGKTGCAGAAGMKGVAGANRGTLTASGYNATNSGGDGMAGSKGGGGGGGTSGPRTVKSPVDDTIVGGSGGGGGGGGYAGSGGKGGGAGGASIAAVVFNCELTIVSSTFMTKGGGTGGAGGGSGLGKGGGAGAKGGDTPSGVSNAGGCAGGDGGAGGNGGPGGGGGGGPSIGIAYFGTKPTTTAVTFTLGTAGAGGASVGNTGNAGVKTDFSVF